MVSWNINFPGAKRAVREGALLREPCPALVLLQEVNPGSAGICSELRADWMVRGEELPCAAPGEAPARRHVAAVAGVGLAYPAHRPSL